MHFEVLGYKRRFKCEIELVKADVIEIKRRPNQVFHFKDASNFIDCLIGHGSCVVQLGKDSADSETWKAYFWEPTLEEAKKAYGYSEGHNLLPTGSLAILETDDEYELEFALESRAKEARRWIDLFDEITKLSKKVRAVDEESEYADPERFTYMGADELEKVLEEIKSEYQQLTRREKVEV